MTFQSHCSSLGIQLLRDDIKFIKSQLLHIPQQLHKRILTEYSEKFLQGIQSTDIVYRQQNIGRRNANTFIRELVENGKYR